MNFQNFRVLNKKIQYLKCCIFLCIGLQTLVAQKILLEKPKPLAKPTENVQKLLYSPQGNYLAAIVLQNKVLLYDAEGQLVRQYSAATHTLWADIAFSPDEKLLALALTRKDSSFLQLYALESGELLQTVFLFPASLSVMEWHTQGEVLMCASERRQLQAWQWLDNTLKRAHQIDWDKSNLDEAWAISATANGRLWAVAGIGGELLIYEWKKQDLHLRQSLDINLPVYGLAFHPTEPKLYASMADKIKNYAYQKRNWTQADSLPTLTPIANQMRFLKHSYDLVAVQQAKIIQYRTNENHIVLPTILWESPQNAHILAHTPNPQQTRWAIATADGKLSLFFVKTFED